MSAYAPLPACRVECAAEPQQAAAVGTPGISLAKEGGSSMRKDGSSASLGSGGAGPRVSSTNARAWGRPAGHIPLMARQREPSIEERMAR